MTMTYSERERELKSLIEKEFTRTVTTPCCAVWGRGHSALCTSKHVPFHTRKGQILNRGRPAGQRLPKAALLLVDSDHVGY